MANNVRDVAMFVIGAMAFLNEVVFGGVERPFIISASLALMGLPLVLKGVTITKNGRNGKNGKNGS